MNEKHIISGAHGKAFKVSAGTEVTITDLEGEQVVDFMAFVSSNIKESLSVCNTRFNLRRLYLLEEDILLTNLQKPIAKIIQDTVGLHNMTAPSCDPHFYKNLGGSSEHRSCFQNFTDVLEEYGIESTDLPAPLNFFQNTPDLFHANHDDKTELSLGEAASKPGDFVKIRFCTDAIFAVSACPFTMFGFNGGKSTPIEISISN